MLNPLHETPEIWTDFLTEVQDVCLESKLEAVGFFPQIVNEEDRMPKRIETAGTHALSTG